MSLSVLLSAPKRKPTWLCVQKEDHLVGTWMSSKGKDQSSCNKTRRSSGEEWGSQSQLVTLQVTPRQAAEPCAPVATPATQGTGSPSQRILAPSPWDTTYGGLGAGQAHSKPSTKGALGRNPGPLSQISCPSWPRGPWPRGFVPWRLTHSASLPCLRCWLAAVSPELGDVIM